MQGEQVQQAKSFHAPGWHGDARTPVIDGKYYDRTTGDLCTASDHQEYQGPPAVDIVINSLHEDTSHCKYRAARPFTVEALLHHIMKIVHERNLEIDSLTATTYAIRVILAHELTVDEFNNVANAMVNGIWGPEG